MNWINGSILILISYLIGSIPTAFIVLKIYAGKDIRKEGSGNVGTWNTMRVTKSPVFTIIVLVGDVLKGITVAYFSGMFFRDMGNNLWLTGIPVVLGHNYPVWLKFKGGRGLATAAGFLLIVKSYTLFFWFIVWIIVYLITKRIIWSSTIATVLFPLFVSFQEDIYFTVFAAGLAGVIILGHSDQLKFR